MSTDAAPNESVDATPGGGRPVLYAMRASLYSSKARSFLIKQGIDYVELPPGDPTYGEQVVPAIGRWIIPVLKTADGALIQDTEDIIAHFDSGLPVERSAFPRDGVLSVLAPVLSMCGSEGMLRIAMHYRWNFDEVNQPFVLEDFSRGLMLGDSNSFGSSFDFGEGFDRKGLDEARAQVANFAGDRMRKLTREFGVDESTIPTVEESFVEFLGLLSEHLERFPYLLGGRPTIADYAFMAPLYAHLARDPYPSALMKSIAWPVWSWVERMIVPIEGTGQYGPVPVDLLPDGQVPDTLKAILAWFGAEMAAELAAHVTVVDEHLAAEQPAEGDVVGGKATRRSLGKARFQWRGHELETAAIPYRLTHVQRIQAAQSNLGEEDQAAIRSALRDAGLELLLDAKASRRIERADNREVWGAEQEPLLPAVG